MTDPREVRIAGRPVCSNTVPYVIVTPAIGRENRIEQVATLLSPAREAGADAVALYGDDGHDVASLSRLSAAAAGLGIAILYAPRNARQIEVARQTEMAAYLITPAAIADLDLIGRLAGSDRPLILSCGQSSIRATADAVTHAAAANGLVVLRGAQPDRSRPEALDLAALNLATLPDMAARFTVLPGFCDHTAGHEAAVAAVALGAVMVEKHLDPVAADAPINAIRALVDGCRTAFMARGAVSYGRAAQPADGESAPNVTIAPLTVEDVSDEYVSWLNDPEVVRYTEVSPGQNDRASVEAYVRKMAGSTKDRTYAIRADGVHVGNIKLSNINPQHGTARVALLIGRRDLWGRGIATRAIQAICREGFETLGLRKLIAGVYAGNHGSVRAFERAGFHTEALLRANRIHEGKIIDEVILCLFRE